MSYGTSTYGLAIYGGTAGGAAPPPPPPPDVPVTDLLNWPLNAALNTGLNEMLRLIQSQATAAERRIPLYLVDDTDGKTPETGLVFAAGELLVSKNGAVEANAAGVITERAGGLYYYEFTQAELDTLGFVTLRVVKAGVRQFIAAHHVVAAPAAYPVPPTTAEIADKILARAIVGGADGGRSVSQALASLRNRVAIDYSTNPPTLNVYAADDVTVLWSAAVTTTQADPVSGVDPV